MDRLVESSQVTSGSITIAQRCISNLSRFTLMITSSVSMVLSEQKPLIKDLAATFTLRQSRLPLWATCVAIHLTRDV